MINCPTCEFADFEKDKCTRLLIRLPHICPYCEERKPRNNFERLKGLSMEEMAAFLANIMDGGYGKCPDGYSDCSNRESCAECWTEWLKEEITDVKKE